MTSFSTILQSNSGKSMAIIAEPGIIPKSYVRDFSINDLSGSTMFEGIIIPSQP
jgi:hypothetical protein